MISFYLYSEREEAGKVPRFHVEPTTHVIRLCTGITLAWADNVSSCLQALESTLHILAGEEIYPK